MALKCKLHLKRLHSCIRNLTITMFCCIILFYYGDNIRIVYVWSFVITTYMALEQLEKKKLRLKCSTWLRKIGNDPRIWWSIMSSTFVGNVIDRNFYKKFQKEELKYIDWKYFLYANVYTFCCTYHAILIFL